MKTVTNTISEKLFLGGLPEGFLFGAGVSGHQVEGGNVHSDWWYAEQQGQLPVSGVAADFYNRYETDFALAAQMGFNVFRIAIEWSRIEPEEGKIDMESVEHYRRMLQSIKRHGLVRMVTLQHFTLPQWVAAKGGWENPDIARWLGTYAGVVAELLGEEIDIFFTINEPEVVLLMSYVRGLHPPFKKNVFLVPRVLRNILASHRSMYEQVKKRLPSAQVGIVKNNVFYEPYYSTVFDRAVVRALSYVGNEYILEKILDHLDIIGLNYYFFDSVSVRGRTTKKACKNDMGWRTYPKGLYYLLKQIGKYKKPIYITENGIANARDDMRQRFIAEHVHWALQARKEGVDVRGYVYWSFLDTYEWHDGYGLKFGLVEVNFETQMRRRRNV